MHVEKLMNDFLQYQKEFFKLGIHLFFVVLRLIFEEILKMLSVAFFWTKLFSRNFMRWILKNDISLPNLLCIFNWYQFSMHKLSEKMKSEAQYLN